jgi:hypothetical protein
MSYKKGLNNGLNMDTDDPLYKLITSIPDYDENTQGEIAREAWRGHIKKHTPGEYVTFANLQLRTPCSRVFYMHSIDACRYEDRVDDQLNLDIDWKRFAIALLCQSIYHQTANTSQLIDIHKVDNDMDSLNDKLMPSAFDWYIYILMEDLMKKYLIDFGGTAEEAKEAYIKNICTQDWVNYKILLYESGKWVHAPWEEFHHWAKLSALGATDQEITSTIDTLRNLGLHIYDEVDENNWKSFDDFIRPSGGITHVEIDPEVKDVENAVVTNDYYDYYGEYPEDYSYRFVTEEADDYRS